MKAHGTIDGRHYFTAEELREVWEDARRRGILYNGMTYDLLHERYGVVIRHEPGMGFYRLGEGTT